MGLGRSRAFLESAISLDAHVRSYGVVASPSTRASRTSASPLLVPLAPPRARRSNRSTRARRARAALCLLAAVCADVVLAAEGAAPRVPAVARGAQRSRADRSLFYHRTSRDVLSVLAVCHVAYPDLQALLGRGRAARCFSSAARARVAAAWFVAWFARVGGAPPEGFRRRRRTCATPWAPRGPYARRARRGVRGARVPRGGGAGGRGMARGALRRIQGGGGGGGPSSGRRWTRRGRCRDARGEALGGLGDVRRGLGRGGRHGVVRAVLERRVKRSAGGARRETERRVETSHVY